MGKTYISAQDALSNFILTKVDVPVVGSSGFLSSYIAGIKFISTGKTLLEEGYAKYRGKMFQIADRNHWHVLVTTPNQVDELRKLPEGTLNDDIAAEEVSCPLSLYF
jgi:hypothetical protein